MVAEHDKLEDIKVINAVMEGVASNLEMLTDREFLTENIRAERVHERPAGLGGVHISFRFGFRTQAGAGQGSMLVPLPDAVSLGAYLMGVPDADVEAHRSSSEPDEGLKDALLEVGNKAGDALEDAVRLLCGPDSKVKFLGCQGVRAGVRPAFEYTEREELIVGRATARIHDFPEFELIMMLPELTPREAASSAS